MPRNPAPLSVSSPLEPSPRAPWLGVTGALMLLVAFALYNPWCHFASKLWPWELLTDAEFSLTEKTILAAWLATGLWCVVFGWLAAQRTRALGCALLTAALIGVSYEPKNLLVAPIVHIGLVAAAALGAGLLLAREPQRRGLGRLAAALGGLVLLWWYVMPHSDGEWQLRKAVLELGAVFGDDAPSLESLLTFALPIALAALAALGGLLVGLGLTGRRLVLIWFLVLLGSTLIGTGAQVAYGYGDRAIGIEGIAEPTVMNIVTMTFLLWLLLTFTLRDLGCMTGGEA